MDYDSNVASARLVKETQANSLDLTLDELARQAMRLDELAVRLEDALVMYLRPDDRVNTPSYPSGVDVPGDASPVAKRVYAQNDNLRVTGNRIEEILRRIDA